MLRRLFTFASAMSLLLCVTIGALWVRSERFTDQVLYERAIASTGNYRRYNLESVGGRVWGEVLDFKGRTLPLGWNRGSAPSGTPTWHIRPQRMPGGQYAALGFELSFADAPAPSAYMPRRVFKLGVPDWFVALFACVLPYSWIRWKWRSGRAPSSACRQCGYDLRATPERCPECGMEAKKPATRTKTL
ncbi:MAG: hypothetical protein JWM97_1067 [Phycisphaerales bacterium]|nr:hypothetical protein [Phycisphaerales bacterium]